MQHGKQKATIYDVAERAGVAISTVSRVLNNSSDVSDATRARVLQAIEELRFRPDRTAKTLAQKQTESLVIAMPSFTTPFHTELLKGVRSRIRDLEYDLLLFDLGSKNPKEKLLDFLGKGSVDGLLLALHVDDELSNELLTLRAPVVLIGNKRPEFDSFYWDDEGGSRSAVNHLIQQGHRRIGIITSPIEDDAMQQRRIHGYQVAMERAGIEVDPNWMQSGQTEKHAGISEESGLEAMQAMLQQPNRVTAVFAIGDTLAIGAWYALRRAGLKVPDDIALIGYNDIKTSLYIGLSSVDQKMQQVGHQATDRMIFRLLNRNTEERVNMLTIPELRVRESSTFDRTK
ncbi:MAG: LacI family DNA-binding transcriptional regulator [Rhodothermales bacterium]